jgi:hypothetical protein
MAGGLHSSLGQTRPLERIPTARRKKNMEAAVTPAKLLAAFVSVERFKSLKIDAVGNDPDFGTVYILR